MRFVMLVKHSEIGSFVGPPPKELMDAIGRLTKEGVGKVIDSGGLAPTAMSTRVGLRGGKLLTMDGPFAEAKEVVGGFAVMEFKSKEEAVQGAREFMELYRKYWPGWEGETEVRPMFGQDEFPAGRHDK